MSRVTDRDKVPVCRVCADSHWSDEVDSDGFCKEHARANCQPEREEGYYWVTDKSHPDPVIAYYGEATSIDFRDRTKEVSVGWSWTLGPIAEGDSLDEYEAKGTLKVHGPRIKPPNDG
jgi:hypothetical protein